MGLCRADRPAGLPSSLLPTARLSLAVIALAFLTSCGEDAEHLVPPGEDTTPPAAVTDLAVGVVTSTTVEVTWTAPGNDGSSGQASTYDLRYALAPITEGDWSSALPIVGGVSVPQPSGASESVVFTGLSPGTTYHFALKTGDEVPNWSGLSNVVVQAVPPGEDTTPPAAVTDLAVGVVTATTVRVRWTAPGDDGSSGQASTYDPRYALAPITEGDWSSALPIPWGAPMPQPTGASESVVFRGLSPGTTYDFALKTADEVPNWSGLSNVVSATTTPVPLPEMILIPAGTFTMGDGSSRSLCGEDERTVTLTRSFFLGQYEVTNDEFLVALQWAYNHGYVSATATSVEDNLDGSTVQLAYLGAIGSEIEFLSGVFSLRNAMRRDHPVTFVSWYGAAAYCDWLSLLEGLPRAYDHATWECGGGDPYGATGYRLPTDAEWEYAAQFDDERIFPWGDEVPTCARANYGGWDCVGRTTAVGSYPGAPDVDGSFLYDMAGNVREWCNDWHECLLGTGTETDPVGPAAGTDRVMRGGSWNSYDLRVAGRNNDGPTACYGSLGFRCARSQ